MQEAKIWIISSVPANPFAKLDFKDLNFSELEKNAALSPELLLFLDGLDEEYRTQSGIKFELIRAIDEKLPQHWDYDAYMLWGSPAMVTDRNEKPRINNLINFVHNEVNSWTPVFGMCFGHQVLATAFGGEVWDMPSRILGSHSTMINVQGKWDEIFKQIDEQLYGLYSHKQSIQSISDEITILWSTKYDPYSIIKVWDNAWWVQFHPEFKPETITFLAKLMQPILIHENISLEDILVNMKDVWSNNGSKLIQLFIKKYYNK